MSNEHIKVMIVDDLTIVREGLKTLLELTEGIEVVGEAGNGRDALGMAGQLQPDVILMDLIMPVMDGIQTTREIHQQFPDIRIIALTSFLEDDKVIPAIQAGATSFLLKDVTPQVLVEAIQAAVCGESRLNPQVTKKLMDNVSVKSPKEYEAAAELTAREMEVLRLIAEGLSNKLIADRLVISEKTVKTHVSSILGKTNLEDRTQLAVYAIKKGFA
jgi:NarL family two-component system response regulator LiaR